MSYRVQRHEPYPENRQSERLSFEGFSCYLTDQENFAVSPEYGCRLKDVSLCDICCQSTRYLVLTTALSNATTPVVVQGSRMRLFVE